MTEGRILVSGAVPDGRFTGNDRGAFAQLARKMGPAIAHAVDELHVTALLESRGVTDAEAQQAYGYRDVFALAEALYHRRPPPGDETRVDLPVLKPLKPRWHRDFRTLVHGPLYMLPSTVYPAVIIGLGSSTVFRVLALTTALGWIWGMGVSATAYQLLGQGMERSAGRAIRSLSLLGIVVALLCGAAFAVTGTGGTGLILYVVAQVAFQLMSGILIFHGKELRLALTLLPAFLMGLVLVVSGYAGQWVKPTLVTGGACVVLLTVTALVTSMRAPARPNSRQQVAFAKTFAGVSPSMCYAALCALYFLNTESRFLTAGGELAIAGLPLILGMGVLEWRATRFTEKARGMFARLASPAEFRRAAWRLLLAELANCLIGLGGLCIAFVLILMRFNLLSGPEAQLADAYVLLGGVFFLGFIMARHQQFSRLLGIMVPVVLAEVLLVGYASQEQVNATQGQIEIFLACTAILLLAQVVALRVSFRRVHRYY
jgi:hypothetical protein